MLRSLIVLAAVSRAFAAVGGGIAGTVSDPSGGVMQEVAVAARNVDTGIVHRTATNDRGFYAFPDLPIGRYGVEVDQPGFVAYRQSGLDVTTNAALRVDIVLALGGRSEASTVSEGAGQVETASTQLGERIAAREMVAIPVNGRSFTDLLALQPGVIPASAQQPNAVVMSGCTNAPPSGQGGANVPAPTPFRWGGRNWRT